MSTAPTLISTALTPIGITTIFQNIACTILGITNNLPLEVTLTQNSNQVTLSNLTGIAVGYLIGESSSNPYGSGSYGQGGFGGPNAIPAGTTILALNENIATLSNNATTDITEIVYITNPLAGTLVRQAWPIQGAPAWGINDDLVFVRAIEVDNLYNKLRDELHAPNDDITIGVEYEYTRVWSVFWELRGPNSFDRARLLKSSLLLDYYCAMLASSNLYLMPSISNPVRMPELFEGQYWERTDLTTHYYEQVNESIAVGTIASIEVIVEDKTGILIDETITA